MATTRKRTSGFSEKATEGEQERKDIEQMLDNIAQETFENLSKEEEVPQEFIPQEVTPSEDLGPRFVEPSIPSPTQVTPAPAKPEAPAKRHPRNIPKFSRFK